MFILYIFVALHTIFAEHDHDRHIDKEAIIEMASKVSENDYATFESNKVYLESSLLKLEMHLDKTKADAVYGNDEEAVA